LSGHGREENICKIVIVKPEGKRLLGRPRHRLENNIKMDHHRMDMRIWTGLISLAI
jgi:hypothetical protein